jgi:hypothetical protein
VIVLPLQVFHVHLIHRHRLMASFHAWRVSVAGMSTIEILSKLLWAVQCNLLRMLLTCWLIPISRTWTSRINKFVLIHDIDDQTNSLLNSVELSRQCRQLEFERLGDWRVSRSYVVDLTW